NKLKRERVKKWTSPNTSYYHLLPHPFIITYHSSLVHLQPFLQLFAHDILPLLRLFGAAMSGVRQAIPGDGIERCFAYSERKPERTVAKFFACFFGMKMLSFADPLRLIRIEKDRDGRHPSAARHRKTALHIFFGGPVFPAVEIFAGHL